MQIKTLSLRSIFIVSVFAASSCSLPKGMKKMEKNTEEMNETTRDLNDTTKGMNDTTKDMNRTTQEMKTATQNMEAKTSEMSQDTKEMQKSTENVAKITAKMADTTEGMATTTQKMASTTDDLKELSSKLKTETVNLYTDNRQGVSLELRNHALEGLNSVSDQFAKISHAAQYFMALEYQLWKGVNADDSTKLAALKKDGIDEMVRTIYEFLPENRSVSPLSNNDKTKDLYAFAATLHIVNTNGILNKLANDPTLAQDGAEPTAQIDSVLDIIKDGLSKKAALEAGTIDVASLEPAQNSVLQHEGVLVYLLQIRSNFVAAMVAQRLAIADGQTLSFFGRIERAFWPWKAKTETRNLAELANFKFLMSSVVDTQKFLKSIGAPAPIDPMLKRFLQDMRFADDQSLSAMVPERATLVKKLATSYQEFLKP